MFLSLSLVPFAAFATLFVKFCRSRNANTLHAPQMLNQRFKEKIHQNPVPLANLLASIAASMVFRCFRSLHFRSTEMCYIGTSSISSRNTKLFGNPPQHHATHATALARSIYAVSMQQWPALWGTSHMPHWLVSSYMLYAQSSHQYVYFFVCFFARVSPLAESFKGHCQGKRFDRLRVSTTKSCSAKTQLH